MRTIATIAYHLAAVLPFLLVLPNSADAAARTYSDPTYLGDQIHHCLANNTGCGKGAADAFCKIEGYQSALTFKLEQDPAHVMTARVIDSGEVLHSPQALPFTSVKCWRPNDSPSSVLFGTSGLKSIALPRRCNIGEDCRKEVADHFCQEKGYSLGAMNYGIAPDDAAFRFITCAAL